MQWIGSAEQRRNVSGPTVPSSESYTRGCSSFDLPPPAHAMPQTQVSYQAPPDWRNPPFTQSCYSALYAISSCTHSHNLFVLKQPFLPSLERMGLAILRVQKSLFISINLTAFTKMKKDHDLRDLHT